jgi:hypothetical protein
MLNQVAGLGLTGAAMSRAGMFAQGGEIKEDTRRPAGLAELAIHKMA